MNDGWLAERPEVDGAEEWSGKQRILSTSPLASAVARETWTQSSRE